MNRKDSFKNKPEKTYSQKHSEFQDKYDVVEKLSDLISMARGLVFFLALVVAWLSYSQNRLAAEWLLVPILGFLCLAYYHSRVAKESQRIQRAQEFYAQRLQHLDGSWEGLGSTGLRYINADHRYTSDLDIFGKGSLFQFLSLARTRFGEDTLADWLSNIADPETIKLRQEAVQELSRNLKLREELATVSSFSDKELSERDLDEWLNSFYSLSQWQRVAGTVLGLLGFLALIAWLLGFGHWPLLLIILLEVPLYLSCFRQIKKMANQADRVCSTLKDLTQVLTLIEETEFKSVLLRELTQALRSNGDVQPSIELARLSRLVASLEQSTRNQMLVPVALLFGIPIQLVFKLEQWRKQTGPSVQLWFKAIGHIEALSSLATYSFEHPENTYPVILPATGYPRFEAQGLSHPLIAVKDAVANDIRLDSAQRLVLLSGSNMSGKSTLLRSVGISIVMGCCGSSVQARQLEMSNFQLGCAMRASDSLTKGTSLFYAVITRIKQIVDLASTEYPVCFLLDEILQGTNSHDRLIGAKGVINELMEHDALGLVTTHDLALTGIVDSIGPTAINLHMQDQFVDDQIYFDYKIRPGVIRTSNGLALMRLIGLKVDSD